MANAYMIENTGNRIPVTFHVYGAPIETYNAINDENTYAASFLLKHSHRNLDVADDYFIVYFAALLATVHDIPQEIAALPYKTIFDGPNGELIDLWHKYEDAARILFEKHQEDLLPESEIIRVNTAVNHALNQTFLRARIGGEYDSVPGCKAAYFRISSTYFNWDKMIYDFVCDHKTEIDTITIERDVESTGSKNIYINRRCNTPIDHMPVEDFMREGSGKIPPPAPAADYRLVGHGPRIVIRAALKSGETVHHISRHLECWGVDEHSVYEIYYFMRARENRSPVYWP